MDDNGGAGYNPDQPATYGMNKQIGGEKLSYWRNPSQLVLVQDAVEHLMDGNGDTLSAWGGTQNLGQWRVGGSSYFPNAIYEYYRHNKWSNVLWMDGHVSGIYESLGKDIPKTWYTGSPIARHRM